MSKNAKKEIQEHLNLELKFKELILNPKDHTKEYQIDEQTLDTLLNLHQWQRDLMIKIFMTGAQKKAIEQFPGAAKGLMVITLKELLVDVEDIQERIKNEEEFKHLVANPADSKYSLAEDTKTTMELLSKSGRIKLWDSIKSEEHLQPEIGCLEQFLVCCKEVFMLFLSLVETKFSAIALSLEELMELCKVEFLNKVDCIKATDVVAGTSSSSNLSIDENLEDVNYRVMLTGNDE